MAAVPSAPEEDDSAEWLCELVGFSASALPAAPAGDSAEEEWLRELVDFSAPAPPAQIDDSTEWLCELLGRSVPAPSAPSSSPAAAAAPAHSPARRPRSISPRAGPALSPARHPRGRSPCGPRAGSLGALQPAVLQPPRRSLTLPPAVLQLPRRSPTSHPAVSQAPRGSPTLQPAILQPLRKSPTPPQKKRHIVASFVVAFPGPALDAPRQGAIVRSFLRDMPDWTDPSAAASLGDDVVAVCLGRLGCWFATFEHVIVFKFGICFDPEHRWGNREFGYLQERMWHFMDLLFVGCAQKCRRLEIALIAETRSIAGCQNEAPGGEGVAAGSEVADPCYCYVVVAAAGHGLGLRRAFDMRQAELARSGA